MYLLFLNLTSSKKILTGNNLLHSLSANGREATVNSCNRPFNINHLTLAASVCGCLEKLYPCYSCLHLLSPLCSFERICGFSVLSCSRCLLQEVKKKSLIKFKTHLKVSRLLVCEA